MPVTSQVSLRGEMKPSREVSQHLVKGLNVAINLVTSHQKHDEQATTNE